MNKKTAVLGANGQVGRALRAIQPNFEYLDREDVDLSDVNSIASVDWSVYSTVINAAAYTAVDKAEEEPELARAINATSVGVIAERLSRHSGTLIHFSTDYVFDGESELHDENEKPQPKSVYGETKYQGELMALSNPDTYVIRTSWVIGDGNNFARTMLRLAKNGVNPNVVNDQYGRPTLANLLAKFALYLCDNDIERGIYNLSNDGPVVSWCDLAKKIFELGGYDSNRVSGVVNDEYFKDKPHAKRPKYSTFNLEKTKRTGFIIHDWRDDLKNYVEEEFNK